MGGANGNARWRPSGYGFEYPDTALSFRFGAVKLLDYRERWVELEGSENPFAVVVMAHLKAQETKKDRQTAIASLPSQPLEELAIALFDFESLTDLETWLTATKLSLLLGQLTERFGVLEEGVGLDLGRLALDSLVGLVVEEVEGVEALEVWMEEQLDGRSR